LSSQLGSKLTMVGTTPSPEELAKINTQPADPAVEAASKVKDRYEAYLLGLPEVVGHGVAHSQSDPHRVVIQLFLRKATDAARKAAPASLEGIPVEIRETGEIRPLSETLGANECAQRRIY